MRAKKKKVRLLDETAAALLATEPDLLLPELPSLLVLSPRPSATYDELLRLLPASPERLDPTIYAFLRSKLEGDDRP